jgi:heme exporter protein A
VLQAVNLSVELEDRYLFNRLNFTLAEGAALQVAGSNGCGKTTLLRILCGLSLPSEGSIYWKQRLITDSADYAGQVIYIGHQTGVRAPLTVVENIQRLQALFPCRHKISLDHLLNQLNLQVLAEKPAKQLSAGQQRRVALAQLIFRDAKLWILDEPFTALDKLASDWLQQLMIEHVQRRGLLIFTSHQAVKLSGIEVQLLELAA